MPLDSTTTPLPASPGLALYRQRREDAAALWMGVPAERFNLERWECGTSACALGWLARARHDGWTSASDGTPIAPDGKSGFWGAASYFGLKQDDADECFSPCDDEAHIHGRSCIKDVTPADVARSLLALPYVGEEG